MRPPTRHSLRVVEIRLQIDVLRAELKDILNTFGGLGEGDYSLSQAIGRLEVFDDDIEDALAFSGFVDAAD